jgi:hypothetical protein
LSDIFQEVDEDLRRERALKLWQKYGNYIIGAAVLVVAATAGFVAWRDYDRKQAEAGAAQYIAAIDQVQAGQPSAAPAIAHVAQEGRGGYAVLARMQEAALKARGGDAAGAAAIYRNVAADSGADRELRDAAALLATLVQADSSNLAEIERQVAAVATPNSPWRHIAWEIMALAAAKAGNLEQARSFYTRISDDPGAPAGLRARAAEMLQALGS